MIVWLGLAQGLILYVLYKTHQEAVWAPQSGPLFNALLLAALLLPFVVYWGQGILAGRRLARLLALIGLLVLGLGAYQGMTVFPLPEANKPRLADFSTYAGLSLVCFMLVPLVSAWSGTRSEGLTLRRWDYALLFEHAWRNSVITVQAGVLTCLFWAVLVLGAQLFRMIGVDWPKEIIEESWFAIPVTTLSNALGIRAGLRRSAFTNTLRNHWLTLTAWLLPIVSLIGAAFALTSMTGVDKLFERGLSAFFLLWFAAFWVKFFNSAFQDGKTAPPFGTWLSRMLPFTSPALAAVSGMALWALLLRVDQHGLTPDRIWGVFVACVALCYGLVYALSLMDRTGWMRRIPDANVLAALIMCAGIVLLLSPVLDACRLSTDSQMARLNSGEVQAGDFDVYALTRQGKAGHEALAGLARQQDAEGKPTHLAFRAIEAIESAQDFGYWENEDRHKEMPVADIVSRLDSFPRDIPPAEDFIGFLREEVAKWEKWERQRSCFDRRNKSSRCTLLQIDLNNDGSEEVVLWRMRSDFHPLMYSRLDGKWRRIGSLQYFGGAGDRQSVQAELYAGEFEARPSAWKELRIGERIYRIDEDTEAGLEE